ncbi:Odorant receptor 216 [Nylanderia fulva]|uniref:Odorant receptor n=1 Tax=Nylanderia fulva TaxID=613905 RepID=A0A6G1LQV6_9HYME|nr:Odorant receptor 216 [Nylanderia fulva]
MESVWSHYYSVTKKMLFFVGQWPYQKKKIRSKLFQCGKNMQCILLCIPSALVFIVILIKFLTCQFLNYKIKHLIDQLYNDWKILKSPKECEIMKAYAAKARLFTLICSILYLICSPLYLCTTLIPKILDIVLPLNESRPIIMPFEAYYFVHDDTEYFYYILFHAAITVTLLITALLAHDCVILTCIEHVCGIFAVAGFRFENLVYNHNRKKNYTDKMYNQKMALSVCVHWRALEFAEFLDRTFSVTLIIQIFATVIGMSVTLLQIAMQLENVVETSRNAALILGQLIHIFCFCLQGQKLIDHSLKIHDKIYNCSWYKMPVKSQRLLLNVMRRSLQPNMLSAGGIYIFSLKSFMTVVQSLISYFMVLAPFQ